MNRSSTGIAPDPYTPECLENSRAAARAEAVGVTRRAFIKLAGMGGGGLVLALSLDPAAGAAPAQRDPGTAFTANPYVQIKPDGTIVLFAKNPEIGQGVKTSLPMIVAEELDAAWQHVQVQQSVIDETLYGPQFAGGSRSVPSNWDSLRRAGATARAMLISAAARRWDVPEGEITTARSVVRHEPSGRSASYGELAEAAASIPVPDAASIRLKKRSEYRLLGTRVTGVDNPGIVRGEPLFGSDQRVPGMRYAVYVRAPAIGARVVSANLERILALPGVEDGFILGKQGDPVNFAPAAPAVLPGVAILATSTWAALRAKRQLEVRWDETEASHDSWTDAEVKARSLVAEPAAQVLGQAGDVDAVFAAAHGTIEAMYRYHYVAHADLEPQNCTAWFKGDSIEIWAPTQTPQAAVEGVAVLLDLPKDKVTLHQLRGGGGFGRRLANDSVFEAAVISKWAGGIPVKLQWTREDDMTFDYYRPGGFHALKAAIDRSGRLSAWQDHFITFTRDGRNPVSGGNLSATEFPASVLANQRLLQSMIASRIPTGPWRAPGSSAIAFAVQSFLHECAVAARRDHLEFLLEVMGEPRYAVAGSNTGLHTGRAANVLRLVAEKAGWGRKLPSGRALGLAFHFSHAGHFAEIADVSVDENRKVKVHKAWVAADIGPIVNLSGAENQCQGAVIDALSTAMGLKVTFENGRVEQSNFDQYPILRIDQAPQVEVHFLQSDHPPTGCGEPALPPAAPAVANAIFTATGQRIRTLPFSAEGYTI